MLIESHVAGGWRTPPDEGNPLLDATSGLEVARVSIVPRAGRRRAGPRPRRRRPRLMAFFGCAASLI